MTDWRHALALLSLIIVPAQTVHAAEPISMHAIEAFRDQIGKCFDSGDLEYEPNADDLYVHISFNLAADGSIEKEPEILHLGPSPSRFLAIAAIKAVKGCAPYKMLPADNHEAWSVVEARFSVAGMQ